jgi:aryl-alcohol dehydrogenase-like predicted oxidoreductase
MVAKAQAIAKDNGWQQFIGLQYYYSAVSRDIEHELVPMAQDHKLAIFPWSPMAGGFLSGKFTRAGAEGGSRRETFDFPPINKDKAYDLVDVMKTIGDAHGATVAQVALAWVRQQPGITSTIIGAKRISQLEDNIKSIDVQLTAEDLQQIDAVSPLPAQYPGWMVKMQSGYRS